MEKFETVAEFYRKNLDVIPDNLKKEIGHFNVFRIEDFVNPVVKPVPYSRKEFFKISLVIGKCNYYFADKTIEVEDYVLYFGNSMIPYNWEPLDRNIKGFFCLFTEEFFNHFGNIKAYPVFKPGDHPFFYPTKEEVDEITFIYKKMEEEIQSEYVYKYDVLRNLVFELMHKAMKMKPATVTLFRGRNANNRIASLFIELLEQQFPIESLQQSMKLRMPADFATHLSVHVNHLNRAVKETLGKTTTACISERILQEARILLKHTNWTIAEIGYALGFDDPSHFISFFRKSMDLTPRAFRA